MNARHDVDPDHALFVVLGNQLFPFRALKPWRRCAFYMAEDAGLCTYVRHHKQKITLFLAAMRSYRDGLRGQGCTVHYEELAADPCQASYEERLQRHLDEHDVRQLIVWEVEDRFFERRLEKLAEVNRLELIVLPSPMFVTTRADLAEWLDGNRPQMATFYRWQRRRLGLLVDDDEQPRGGRWSFDADNRMALGADQVVPDTAWARPTQHVRDLVPLVCRRFADHPGQLSVETWWLPTTRRQALAWLRAFLRDRLALFGPYEDALSTRAPFLFHSVLSPLLNLGLLTPRETLDRTLSFANRHDVPLNSLEGFLRQLVGWREFVRGIYQRHHERQEATNFFGHQRSLTTAWFEGRTGLPPLDDVIRKALRFGWAHHIERLMVAGNLMTLCEIAPEQAYRWFMEMFVDSSDWVMVPNVYGMGIFSDGGIFSTKPYICGSNYIRKMSDYPRPADGGLFGDADFDWCDVIDGLYWRFVDRHRDFFRTQARMARAIGTLDGMKTQRRQHIFAAAEAFLARATD